MKHGQTKTTSSPVRQSAITISALFSAWGLLVAVDSSIGGSTVSSARDAVTSFAATVGFIVLLAAIVSLVAPKYVLVAPWRRDLSRLKGFLLNLCSGALILGLIGWLAPFGSGDFERGIQAQLKQFTSNGRPLLEPGFGLQIGGDFTTMRSRAPILDVTAEDFHAGNAYFWHETVAKGFLVRFPNISESFKKLLVDNHILANNDEADFWTLQQSVRDLLRAAISGEIASEKLNRIGGVLREFSPQQQDDEYVQDFLLEYVTSWRRVALVIVGFKRACDSGETLQVPLGPDLTLDGVESSTDLLKASIFDASMNPGDPTMKYAMYLTVSR